MLAFGIGGKQREKSDIMRRKGKSTAPGAVEVFQP